jgi:hypothetical protein
MPPADFDRWLALLAQADVLVERVRVEAKRMPPSRERDQLIAHLLSQRHAISYIHDLKWEEKRRVERP